MLAQTVMMVTPFYRSPMDQNVETDLNEAPGHHSTFILDTDDTDSRREREWSTAIS